MASKVISEHNVKPDDDIDENRNISIEQRDLLNEAPKTLQRPAHNILLNICVDIFGILSWAGMSAYAATLWYFNGTLVKDLGFSADYLLNTARIVSCSLCISSMFQLISDSFRPSFPLFLQQPSAVY